MADNRRVLIIGLDGATFDLIGPWVEEGKLPTLARLTREGAWGPLRSTIHPITAAAWSSFITGVNPGKHGIFDFTRSRPGTYQFDLVNAALRGAPSLWQMLNEAGRTTGAINVPMTYPPESVEGYLVSGIDTPDLGSEFTYPAALAEEIREKHLIAISTVGKSLEAYLLAALDAVDRRFEVLDYLRQRYPTDLTMKVIMETDAIQHLAWHLLQEPDHPLSRAILQVYQRIDRRLGDLLGELGDGTTLFIMSDHGAGPINKVVYLDNWLESQGLLHFVGEGYRSAGQWLRGAAVAVLRSLVFTGQRYLPQAIKNRLKRMVGVRSQVDSFMGYSQIDWSRSQVFSAGNQGSLYVNVAGRYPNGVVPAGEAYEAIRGQLIESLISLRDPDTGEPTVDAVYRAEELYSGPYVHLAPDLLIRWKDDEYVAKKEYGGRGGEVFGTHLTLGKYGSGHELAQTGTHKLHGILIAWGRHVEPGTLVRGADIIDLVPTILHLMDVPLPGHLDGRVLTECFTESFRRDHPVQHTVGGSPDDRTPNGDATYSEEDREVIQERLRQLGYLA